MRGGKYGGRRRRIHGLYDTIHAQTGVHLAASLGSAVTVARLVFIAAQPV